MRPSFALTFVGAFCIVLVAHGQSSDEYYSDEYYSDEESCVPFGDKCLSPEEAGKLLKDQAKVNAHTKNALKATSIALEKSSNATEFLQDKVGKLKNMLTRERASASMPQCDDKWAKYFPRYCGLAKKCNGLGPKQCQCLLCVASPDLTDGALVGFVPPPLVGTFWSKLASGCSRKVMEQCLTPIPTFQDMLKGTSRKKEVTPVDGLVALAETGISVEQWTFFLNRFGEHASESDTLGDFADTLNQTAWNGVTKEFSAMDEFEKRIARSELKVMRQTYYDAMEKEVYKLRHCDSYELARLFLSKKEIKAAKAQKDQLCPKSVNDGKCQTDAGLPFIDPRGYPQNTGFFYFLATCDKGAHDPKKCKTVCETTCQTAFDDAWPQCDASAFRRVQEKKNGEVAPVSDDEASKNQDKYCKERCRSSCNQRYAGRISGSYKPFLRAGSIPEDRDDRDATCVYEPYGFKDTKNRIKLKAPITAMCLRGYGTKTSAGPSTNFYYAPKGRRVKSQHRLIRYMATRFRAAMYLVPPDPERNAPLRPFTLSNMTNLDLKKAKFAMDDREELFKGTKTDRRMWASFKNKLSKSKKCTRIFAKLAADTDRTYERALAAKGIDLHEKKTAVGRRRLSQTGQPDSLS